MCCTFAALIHSICIFSSSIIIHLLVFLLLNTSATSLPHLLPPSKGMLVKCYLYLYLLFSGTHTTCSHACPVFRKEPWTIWNLYDLFQLYLPLSNHYLVHISPETFWYMFWNILCLSTVGLHLFNLIRRLLSENWTPLHCLFFSILLPNQFVTPYCIDSWALHLTCYTHVICPAVSKSAPGQVNRYVLSTVCWTTHLTISAAPCYVQSLDPPLVFQQLPFFFCLTIIWPPLAIYAVAFCLHALLHILCNLQCVHQHLPIPPPQWHAGCIPKTVSHWFNVAAVGDE